MSSQWSLCSLSAVHPFLSYSVVFPVLSSLSLSCCLTLHKHLLQCWPGGYGGHEHLSPHSSWHCPCLFLMLNINFPGYSSLGWQLFTLKAWNTLFQGIETPPWLRACTHLGEDLSNSSSQRSGASGLCRHYIHVHICTCFKKRNTLFFSGF